MHAIIYIRRDNGSEFRLCRKASRADAETHAANFKPCVRYVIEEVPPTERGRA